MRSSDLVADCDRCAALCCVWLGFDAGPAFGFSKPAGTPCAHLRGTRCGIHVSLVRRGFAGCAAFDCYGAGQRATYLGGQVEVFTILREIHELMWTLDGTAGLCETLAGRIAPLVQALAAIDSVEAILAADLTTHRAAARTLLVEARGLFSARMTRR